MIVQLLFLLLQVGLGLATPTYLNLTAISAADGVSTLECWQLSKPFSTSSQAGTAGTAIEQLGNVANTTFTVLPPNFDGGAHNAPAVQYVAFLSGKAVVSLPTSSQIATIKGGKFGLIIATDTASVSKGGHITKYPSNVETIVLEIPTAKGTIPAHSILHEGPCTSRELSY